MSETNTPKIDRDAAVAALSNLDRAILDALGISVVSTGPERVTLSMTVAPAMLNSQSVCHGGYLFTLADTACAYAAAAEGMLPVTLDATIDFLAPARPDDRLQATARLRSRGRRAAHGETQIARDDGTIVASYRAALINRRS